MMVYMCMCEREREGVCNEKEDGVWREHGVCVGTFNSSSGPSVQSMIPAITQTLDPSSQPRAHPVENPGILKGKDEKNKTRRQEGNET